VREVVNGLMYILSTGCQWRAIAKDLPPRSTLYDYFDLWGWKRHILVDTQGLLMHAIVHAADVQDRAHRDRAP
jgi:transposase